MLYEVITRHGVFECKAMFILRRIQPVECHMPCHRLCPEHTAETPFFLAGVITSYSIHYTKLYEDATDLPMVKLKHYEAAERWERLAAEAERTEIAGKSFSPSRQDMFY